MNQVVFAPLCERHDSCFTRAIGELLTSPSLLAQFCPECGQECVIRHFPVQTSSILAPASWQLEEIKRFVENSSIPLPTDWTVAWRQQIQKNFLSINIV